MRQFTLFALLIALLSAMTIVPAEAAPVIYFGGPDESKLSMANSSAARNAFVSQLSSYGEEDLESLSSVEPTFQFGGFGVTATTSFSAPIPFATYAVSGDNFIWDTEGVDDWLQLSAPVTAFGAYITQAGDGPANQYTIRLENTLLGTSKDVSFGQLGPDWSMFNVIFVGVTDTDPFDRISLIESHDNDGMLYDDFIIGYVVPEPASVVMLLVGAGLIGLVGWRKRHR